MSNLRTITRALISVYHKDGLDDILKLLNASGVQFVSTGGTRDFILSQGYECVAVEDLTGYPSILGGRVKTLHPAIFGGILSRRDLQQDIDQCREYNIGDIDLVIVDLYPFVETVKSGASEADIIEKIDIGGISLIRAAAKNFAHTVIIASKAQYEPLAHILGEQGAATTLEQRKWFAAEAFAVSSGYDTAIFNYFAGQEESTDALRVAFDGAHVMRYGENPHQKGVFYGRLDDMFDKLHGKDISYNNLLDIDAAVSLITDFSDVQGATFAILKHNNACGVATRKTVLEAWTCALAGDPVSAFGGVLVTNAKVDVATAEEIHKLFFEVIIAPAYDDEALEILKQRKNRIILLQKQPLDTTVSMRSCLNGMLKQERDLKVESEQDMTCVTRRHVTLGSEADLIFANKIVKHSKSNAIVLAKNQQLLASGVGQTSRVDALNQAINKALSFGFSLQGAVLASDAFFPFADCVELAWRAGITDIIQPGGSIRDNDSIAFCDDHDLAMVMTGARHFKH